MNVEDKISQSEFNQLCSTKGVYKVSGGKETVKVVLQDLSCIVCFNNQKTNKSNNANEMIYLLFPDQGSAKIVGFED